MATTNNYNVITSRANGLKNHSVSQSHNNFATFGTKSAISIKKWSGFRSPRSIVAHFNRRAYPGIPLSVILSTPFVPQSRPMLYPRTNRFDNQFVHKLLEAQIFRKRFFNVVLQIKFTVSLILARPVSPEDTVYIPQSDDFIPHITQRTIRRALPGLRKLDTSIPYSRRIVTCSNEKRRDIEIRLSRMHKYFPQMNFMPHLPIDFTIKPTDININHKIDPQFTELLVKFENILSHGIDVRTSSNVNIDINFKHIAAISAISAAALFHYSKNDGVSLTTLLAVISTSVLSGSLPFSTVIMQLIADLSEYSHSFFDPTPKPQMNSTTFSNIISSITLILVGLLSGSPTRKPWFQVIIESLFSFKKNTDSLESAITSIISIIENIVNYVRLDIFGLPTLTFLESDRADLNNFVERSRKLQDEIHLGKFTHNMENALRVHLLWQECLGIVQKLPKSESSGMVSSLNSMLFYLSSVKKTLDGMNLSTEGPRVEPVIVLFRGAPAVGKSNVMVHLSNILAVYLAPEDSKEAIRQNPQAAIWNCMSETVYSDGYSPDKSVVQIDDLLQAPDDKTNPDGEPMRIIRMGSMFEYVMHMASLEKKGNVRFNSKVIIASTNRTNFNVESITESDALKRRFDIVLEMVPKIEFTDPKTLGSLRSRRIDNSTLPLGQCGISSLRPEISEFHEYNIMTSINGTPTGIVYDFPQLVDKIKQLLDLKALRFKQYALEIKDTIDIYLPQSNNAVDISMLPIDGDIVEDFIIENQEDPTFLPKVIEIQKHVYDIHNTTLNAKQAIAFAFAKFGAKAREFFSHTLENLKLVLMGIHSYVTKESSECLPTIKFMDFITPIKNAMDKGYTTISKLIASTPVPALFLDAVFMQRLKFVLGLVASLISIGITLDILKKLKNYLFPSNIEPQEYSGKPQKERGKASQKGVTLRELKARALAPATFVPQSEFKYDHGNISIVDKVLNRNVYTMVLPDQENHLGHVTFIRGTIMMINKHFVDKIYHILADYPEYNDKLITFNKYGTTTKFQIPMNEMFNIVSGTDLESLDVVFLKMPRHVPQHADISKFFLTRSQISGLRDIHFRLVIPSPSSNWMGRANLISSQIVSGDNGYVLAKAFSYTAMTKGGDCGSLFTLLDTQKGGARLMGIHSAGSPLTGAGLSSVVCYEDVMEGLKDTDEILSSFEDDVFPQSNNSEINSNFGKLYEVVHPVSSSGATSIAKSVLYGAWGSALTAPAVLRPKDGIHPFTIACETYAQPYVYIDPKIFKDIGKAVLSRMNHVSEIPTHRILLTFEEAISGIEGTTFKGIPRSTSAGYPYNAKPGKKFPGKVEFFGSNEKFDLSTPLACQLRLEVETILADAHIKVRHLHVNTDCLKDERRKHAKVLEMKTRLFSACPLPLLVSFRILFGGFVKWTQDNRIKNGFSVGVNPFSTEWQELASSLLRFGTHQTENIGAGDYKGYDGSEKATILYAILDLINAWYDDEHSVARATLWQEIVNSRHIYGKTIFEWFSSMNSGCPLTTVINNIYNHFVAHYSWWKVHKFNPKDLYDFYIYVSFHSFGDDNIFAVDQNKKHLFNESTMSDGAADLGMTYTTEMKTATGSKLRNITQVSYLKRGFRHEPLLDRFVAPLQLDVIMETPYWTKQHDPIAITDANVNSSLRELSLHSKEIFNENAPKILNAYRNICGKVPPMVHRSALIMAVDGSEDWY